MWTQRLGAAPSPLESCSVSTSFVLPLYSLSELKVAWHDGEGECHVFFTVTCVDFAYTLNWLKQ